MKNPKCILPTLIVLGTVLANPASAALKTWNGSAGDTLWSSGVNWSPAGAPGASDNLTFINDGVSDNPIVLGGSVNSVIATGEPTTPPTIAVSYSPTSISLSWPAAYTSFALRGQTNPITVGLSNNWGPVPGVAGNQIIIPRQPANGSVFFQLFQQ